MLETNKYVRVISLDFSKAFDCIKHSELMDKYSKLDMPDCVYNWLVDFFSGRQHCTKYNEITSDFCSISASVIQGSALGPTSFSVTAANLRPIYKQNEIVKFADDIYLIIPSENIESTAIEMSNIDSWSESNNLKLNRKKSREIIFYSPRSKFTKTETPYLEGIERVDTLKSLGVIIQSNFSFSRHIDEIINSCASNLFALRTLKAKGLNSDLINTVFKATVLSKLTYASQFWWGFLNTNDKNRLEVFLRKSERFGFYSGSTTFETLANIADDRLFNSITDNTQHVLYPLLPPRKENHYHDLRPRFHNFTLPIKQNSLSEKNFICRMLYKNIHVC